MGSCRELPCPGPGNAWRSFIQWPIWPDWPAPRGLGWNCVRTHPTCLLPLLKPAPCPFAKRWIPKKHRSSQIPSQHHLLENPTLDTDNWGPRERTRRCIFKNANLNITPAPPEDTQISRRGYYCFALGWKLEILSPVSKFDGFFFLFPLHFTN